MSTLLEWIGKQLRTRRRREVAREINRLFGGVSPRQPECFAILPYHGLARVVSRLNRVGKPRPLSRSRVDLSNPIGFEVPRLRERNRMLTVNPVNLSQLGIRFLGTRKETIRALAEESLHLKSEVAPAE